MGNQDQAAPNLCNLISHDYFIDICQMLSSLMGYNRQINVTFKFTKKFFFGENWQFGPTSAQDYATLYQMI